MDVDIPWLLRTWRGEVAGLRAIDIAEQLGVAKTTISQWESGKRGVDFQTLQHLDELYQAHGTLIGLAQAVGSPEGLAARQTWWHNFDGPSGPVWAWLRPQRGEQRITARLSWGPLFLKVNKTCNDSGVFVTIPASSAIPPVRVELELPGWVDFGCGTVPPALGIPAVKALRHLRLTNDHEDIVGAFAERLRHFLGGHKRWIKNVQTFLGHRPDLVERVLSQPSPRHTTTDLTMMPIAEPSRPVGFSGTQYRMLREARQLSQADTALRVTALLSDIPVDDEKVRLIETGGTPRVRQLKSRLDMVYRADGHTMTEPAEQHFITDEVRDVTFPRYWIGPVWAKLTAPHPKDVGDVELQWGPWRKHVRMRSGMTVTTRCCHDDGLPLRIETPPNWHVVSGIGFHPSAVNINAGWSPINERSARAILDEMYGVYLTLFGRTPGEFVRFVRKLRLGTNHRHSDASTTTDYSTSVSSSSTTS